MKTYIVSLGCPKNLTDTEEIMGTLQNAGIEIVTSEQDADALLINTCAFIKPAVTEAKAEIRRALKLKKNGRIKRVAVAGCLVQREGSALREQFPAVDAFIGIGSLEDAAKALKTGRDRFGKMPKTLASPKAKIRATMPHTAYLKLADGCNNRCAYCTIPYIRGPFRSKPLEEVVAEARALAEAGARELSLIAQDTTSYGQDLYGGSALCAAIKKIARIKEVRWIRIMYAYPERVTAELIALMAREPKVCRYLDIPLQHISDPVLRAMNRCSTEKLIREKIAALRAAMPDIAIRTNFIVGFPGETAQDFEKLKAFVRDMKFSNVGVFEYCREDGTPAAAMKKQVSTAVKKARAEELIGVQSRVVDALNKKLRGKVLDVMPDGERFGRSYMDAPDIDGGVVVDTPKPLEAGKIVRVKITGGEGYLRRGVIAKR